MVVGISEEQMLKLGLEIAGFKPTGRPETSLRRFRELYGGNPKGTAAVFIDLQTINIGEAKINKICVFYFLMALYYARGYGVESRVMVVFGLSCTKSFRNHVWQYLEAIQALKAEKVNEY